jgi:hypothetical protein
VKKLRALALVAVVAAVTAKVRDYARQHPEEAGRAADALEDLVRDRAAPGYESYVDTGSTVLRTGLGIPSRSSGPGPEADLDDPDPDTDEPWHPHARGDTVAPNPAPGTSDDPQPRREADDAAPMTPGEHLGP